MSAPDALAPALERIVAERQADRLPSVAAAVVRKGEVVWSGAAGSASYDETRGATPDTQYRIGSITKTFTATAVMQLRDAGALDLDDRLEQHLDDVANGTPTIRRMLCHLSGLQREAGGTWLGGASLTEETLVDSMRDVPFVLRPGEQHHYSNLAFALLGQVVARKSGRPYMDYVDERIIEPLGLERTTWQPREPKAQGYLVDDYAGTVWQEPESHLVATAPSGQLWSTAGDLAHWAAFVARGADGVLDAQTVEEMWSVQVMRDPDDWTLGWGLGLMLYNHEGRIYGGHGGAMAGHLAGVYIDRKSETGAAALTNSSTRGDMDMTAIRLAAKTIELWPEEIAAWRPEEEPPADVRPLLGRWWSEGSEFVFTWEDGALRANVAAAPDKRRQTIFERDGDGFLAVRGRERGERLTVEGEKLSWAGYDFTRAQEPFEA